MKPSFIAFLLISLFFLNPSDADTLSVALPDKIKVSIVEEAQEIELAIKGPYKITTIETSEVLKSGDVLWSAKFHPTNFGIHLKTSKIENFKIYGINIVPQNSPSIYVGKCLYRGTLQLIKTPNGLLTAINVLDIEDYLKGVLYHEISHRWPDEAIKAQAIASRTFAIYQAQQNFDKDYYLGADAGSQMYRGVFAEKLRTNKAIEETKSEVLMYRGRVLPAFFHSACGGKTEDASNLWKISLKPLKGVTCTFCKNSPYFNWEREISLDEIKEKISKVKGSVGKPPHQLESSHGYNNWCGGKIKSIKILSRNKSGRVKNLLIKCAEETTSMTAKEFRSIIGSKILSSTNFTVSIKGNKAYFKGYGWGHGVGMCQWGAFAMAKKGYNYKQILEYYYPGAKVVKLK